MVEILFSKKSQNLCGRDEVFDCGEKISTVMLAETLGVFVMLNNCLDEVHARILV